MKFKLLAGGLLVSLLCNIAGLVFFILFLAKHGQLKSVKRERAALEQQLAVLRSGKMIGEAMGSEKILKRTFVSVLDGQMDWYGFAPPRYLAGRTDYTLIVYLHGMGSNYMEPFVTPARGSIADAICSYNPECAILSPNYRKEQSWGNDAAISDISQNIRQVLAEYPFARVVIMGTSMGGCTSLNYAAVAPADIKPLIKGVVSMEGAGDLVQLYRSTSQPGVARAMIMGFAGSPEQIPEVYSRKSFFSNLADTTPAMRFYILGARADKVVPFSLQQEIVRRLESRKLATRFEIIDGDHQVPAASFYVEGLKFVLSNN